jgi:hypothetical protein
MEEKDVRRQVPAEELSVLIESWRVAYASMATSVAEHGDGALVFLDNVVGELTMMESSALRLIRTYAPWLEGVWLGKKYDPGEEWEYVAGIAHLPAAGLARELRDRLAVLEALVPEVARGDSPEPPRSRGARPASNSIHIHSMHNSTIVQGSPGAAILQSPTPAELEDTRRWLSDAREWLSQARLAGATHAEATSMMTAIETQLSSAKPRPGMVAESLCSLRRILEEAVGNMVGTDLLSRLPVILSYFS